MVSRKRSQGPSVLDDTTNKRPRLEESPSDDSHSSSSASSTSSDDSDDGDHIAIEEAELERRAELAIGRLFGRPSANVAADSGIIERVDCYNFMCHEHFSIELGPLINFVVGKNGSGKSAVLTAITLCLGGKASVTNRGQSLKSFIKEGKESSTIVVRLKNQGADAYQENVYGRSIIIERHFSRNGTSGFRLKARSGTIVSTKKGDLDAITDYFTLQIDNPLNVLSQDMARQFLSSSSPAEKYKFFVKGVQLEQLDQDYRMIEQTIDQIQAQIDMRMDEVRALERERDRTQGQLVLSDRQESLRTRVRNLRCQMAWIQVEDQEKHRDSLANEKETLQQTIASLESQVESLDQIFQDADRENTQALAAVTEVKIVQSSLEESKKEIQERLDDSSEQRSELQTTQALIRSQLREAEERIRGYRKKIEDETLRLENLNGGANVQRLSQFEEKNAAAAELRDRYTSHKENSDSVARAVQAADENAAKMKAPIIRKRDEIAQAEIHVRELMKDKGQHLGAFHPKLHLLLPAIEAERSFTERPVGPLGRHVRLLQPIWSSVLESSLGATLSSFIVTSKHDMNILSNIMRRVQCDLPILIANSSGNIDTSAHEPDANFETVLKSLEIDNDLVRRQLIINHSIEQVLLIENVEEASAVMFDGQRPRNVKRCYCLDARDKRRGIHLAYGRTGEPSQSPISMNHKAPRMKTDSEIQIRLEREAIEGLKRDLTQLQEGQRNAMDQLNQCRQALTRHTAQEKRMQIEYQRAEDAAQELKDAIDQDSSNEGHLEALKSSLVEAEKERDLNERSFEDGINARDKVSNIMRDIKRELKAKEEEIARARDDIRRAEAEQANFAAARREALNNKNTLIEDVDGSKRKMLDVAQQHEETIARILDFREMASRVSPQVPIDPGETTMSLEKKLGKLTGDLSRYEAEMGQSREQIAALAAEASAKYEHSKEQLRSFKDMARLFKSSLMHRQERWLKFRSHISSRAKVQFTYLLSERSFRGKLVADHRAKLLDVEVEPDNSKNSNGRGATTLSGGEKSFSQICLLLALWEAMGSRIRCLDEFDVYMDSVNRNMAIEIMMGAARRSVGRQFVLITPGARNDIPVSPDVRVIELAAPERGQQPLPFRR
ncbi:Structural maintenance of chromosomes protein 6 [Myotisia sp. PD_48]|nr:Structural maintenance of chromosomes protein 6 [Myotisia sp. PD_48]